MVNSIKKDDPSGLLVAGFLLIGMGLGFLYSRFLEGLFIGLGVGILSMFFAQIILDKKKK